MASDFDAMVDEVARRYWSSVELAEDCAQASVAASSWTDGGGGGRGGGAVLNAVERITKARADMRAMWDALALVDPVTIGKTTITAAQLFRMQIVHDVSADGIARKKGVPISGHSRKVIRDLKRRTMLAAAHAVGIETSVIMGAARSVGVIWCEAGPVQVWHCEGVAADAVERDAAGNILAGPIDLKKGSLSDVV